MMKVDLEARKVVKAIEANPRCYGYRINSDGAAWISFWEVHGTTEGFYYYSLDMDVVMLAPMLMEWADRDTMRPSVYKSVIAKLKQRAQIINPAMA